MNTPTRKYLGCETSEDVPNNDTAKLMYYIKAVSQVLDLINERKFEILTDHQKYYRLSDEEIDRLVLLCVLFNPQALQNKCMFENDKFCEKNKFIISDVSSVPEKIHVRESIYIGGKVRSVNNVMYVGSCFIKFFYSKPMEFFESRRQRLLKKYQLNVNDNPSSARKSCYCMLL